MGDRRQIIIRQGKNEALYLYTHWMGQELPGILQNALKKIRTTDYDDEIVLPIGIIREMMDANNWSWEDQSGKGTLGIASSPIDSDYRNDVVVDIPSLTVSIGERKWSFYDYVNADTEAF